jgi:Family of unknown function (DUF6325)
MKRIGNENIMDIGPLEYIVIGVNDQQLTRELFSELNEIQETGMIRVVDLILVKKAADGGVVMQEVSELDEEESAVYAGVVDDLMGLLTTQDIEQLTAQIPPDTSALVILFEHTWVIGLTEAIRKAGGVVFTGGMVSHEAVAHVSAELAAAKEAQDA